MDSLAFICGFLLTDTMGSVAEAVYRVCDISQQELGEERRILKVNGERKWRRSETVLKGYENARTYACTNVS